MGVRLRGGVRVRLKVVSCYKRLQTGAKFPLITTAGVAPSALSLAIIL